MISASKTVILTLYISICTTTWKQHACHAEQRLATVVQQQYISAAVTECDAFSSAQVGKKLVLLYVQPQHQDVDLSTPACLDKFAVGTLLLSLSTHGLARSFWHLDQTGIWCMFYLAQWRATIG